MRKSAMKAAAPRGDADRGSPHRQSQPHQRGRALLFHQGGRRTRGHRLGNLLFDHIGEITYPASAGDADTVMEAAIGPVPRMSPPT